MALEDGVSVVREDNWDSCEYLRRVERPEGSSCPSLSSTMWLFLGWRWLWFEYRVKVGGVVVVVDGVGSLLFLAVEENEDDSLRSSFAVNRDSRPSASGMVKGWPRPRTVCGPPTGTDRRSDGIELSATPFCDLHQNAGSSNMDKPRERQLGPEEVYVQLVIGVGVVGEEAAMSSHVHSSIWSRSLLLSNVVWWWWWWWWW